MPRRHSDWVLRFQAEVRPLVAKYRGIGCSPTELLNGLGDIAEELQDDEGALEGPPVENDDNSKPPG